MAANLTHQSSLPSTPMEVTSMLLERPLEQRDTHSSVTGYCRACSRTMPRCQSLEECRAITYRRDVRPAAPSSAALIATTTHMRGINRLCVAVKCRLNEHFTRCCRAVDRMSTCSDDALRSTCSLRHAHHRCNRRMLKNSNISLEIGHFLRCDRRHILLQRPGVISLCRAAALELRNAGCDRWRDCYERFQRVEQAASGSP
ncbi:hypothetical protein Psta_4398 [Pirellula staleyi DSM 6068]|uniref:Uncharacterized protein n=1 Tax=Pirellula staleyi (strain ATCC 27377 / DSM 6068 / ICPB 4128) TaxID=530564 RepID=D2R5V9_PIRSD|nr:hypothetical protein Psta_4398 [Pirellula staleyi DSM 6068]